MTPPSNFALRIIVEEDPRLVRSLNASYADAASDGGLDRAAWMPPGDSWPRFSPR